MRLIYELIYKAAFVVCVLVFLYTYYYLLGKGWGMTQLKCFLAATFLVFSSAVFAEVIIIMTPAGPVPCIIEQGVVACI